jgi:hypothetical protein
VRVHSLAGVSNAAVGPVGMNPKTDAKNVDSGVLGDGFPPGFVREILRASAWVKSSAEEEDSDAVVEEVTEPSGIGLEGLDFGVKPLGNSISDWEENEVKQTVEMAFKHTGHLLDFGPASYRPGVPLFENP